MMFLMCFASAFAPAGNDERRHWAGGERRTRMKCPYCGNDESPDSKFCGNCGQPLQQQVSQAAPRRSPQYRRCPSLCGATAGDSSCTTARRRIRAAPAAPQEPLQPTQPLQPAQSQPQPQQPVAQPAWPQAQQFAQPSGAGVSTPAAPATQPSAAMPAVPGQTPKPKSRGKLIGLIVAW